jgi:hypothetical protein
MGVGYYYLGTSSVLRQTLGPVAPSGNEQGFELYYNAAITRWITMTADIQTGDGSRAAAGFTFIPGRTSAGDERARGRAIEGDAAPGRPRLEPVKPWVSTGRATTPPSGTRSSCSPGRSTVTKRGSTPS